MHTSESEIGASIETNNAVSCSLVPSRLLPWNECMIFNGMEHLIIPRLVQYITVEILDKWNRARKYVENRHVNWEQIDWGGVDSNIAKLQGLKGVGLVIPWQIGNHRFSGRTIDEQMNIVRSVNEMSGLPGANSGITQTIRGYFPLIQNRCRLQIRYQEIKV